MCLLLLQVIADLKGSESSWSFQTPPSSPSSLGSRKSSMCSISSLNSSSSGSTKSHHSPNHQYWHRSVSQVCRGLLVPYHILFQMAVCRVGRWISAFQRNTLPPSSEYKWPEYGPAACCHKPQDQNSKLYPCWNLRKLTSTQNFIISCVHIDIFHGIIQDKGYNYSKFL